MEVFQYCKLQWGCFMVLLLVGYWMLRDDKIKCNPIFDVFFVLCQVETLLDGITACTVNYLGSIPQAVNRFLHLGFYLSMDFLMYVLFLYYLSITIGLPKRTWLKALLIIPFALVIGVVITFIDDIEYLSTPVTNYSMGISVIATFAGALLLTIATLCLLIFCRRYFESRKRFALITTSVTTLIVIILAALIPDLLCTSLAVVFMALGGSLSLENPGEKHAQNLHQEMIMGFATLVENRDGSTGGHIRRTKKYVELMIEEMKKLPKYKKIFTKDYINSVVQAAPMHDIGKIAIPDYVLQKPGRLTPEEYEIMKTHSVRGAAIISDTFWHTNEDPLYNKTVLEVARHHHEKWNGKGYPDGLSETQIPLSARIMAVADVFDAVSAKRCYRDAMSLDDSFEIIQKGVGSDFDPEIAQIFLNMRPKIQAVIQDSNNNKL